MDFHSDIVKFLEAPPEGWRAKVSLSGFARLPEERKRYYLPVYAKYRTKKIRDYDLDTGDFVGWRPIQVGIGSPVGYRYAGYFAARLIDSVLGSNVLMARVLGKKDV